MAALRNGSLRALPDWCWDGLVRSLGRATQVADRTWYRSFLCTGTHPLLPSPYGERVALPLSRTRGAGVVVSYAAAGVLLLAISPRLRPVVPFAAFPVPTMTFLVGVVLVGPVDDLSAMARSAGKSHTIP